MVGGNASAIPGISSYFLVCEVKRIVGSELTLS